MYNPPFWCEWRVPFSWGILPSSVDMMKVLIARDNQDIELMIGFDGELYWRRNFCEYRELGL